MIYADSYTSDPSRIGVGAKPLSLGKATTALSKDPTSMFTNPAGLAKLENINFTSMSGKLLNDYDYITVGVSHPMGSGTLAIGYINAGTSGIPITTLTGSGTTAAVNVVSSTDYNSSVLTIAYAALLEQAPILNMIKNPSVGLTVKVFSQGFTNTSSLEGAFGTGLDLDLGSQWQATPWLNLGVNFKNFLPSTSGGRFTWQANNTVEEIPMSIFLGSAIDLIDHDGLYQAGGQKLTLYIDSEMAYREVRPGLWHLGCEWQPIGLLAIRAGIDQGISATDAGSSTVENNLCAGIGINLKDWSFDYAYHRFGELDLTTSHFFSLGLEF